jgi:hypothetical protein
LKAREQIATALNDIPSFFAPKKEAKKGATGPRFL